MTYYQVKYLSESIARDARSCCLAAWVTTKIIATRQQH